MLGNFRQKKLKLNYERMLRIQAFDLCYPNLKIDPDQTHSHKFMAFGDAIG